MVPDAPSPFVEITHTDWVCANTFAFAVYDRFPVSPGHVLVITRRVVPTFFECTADEQAALMELVGEVKRLLDQREPKPNGYNVGFNSGAAAGQTVPHVHVHVIPRYAGDMVDPRGGVRHVIPEKGNYLAESRPLAPQAEPNKPLAEQAVYFLTTGPDRPLWHRLADRLPGASEVDLLASFVQTSGLDLVGKSLFRAIAAGAKVRLLVGDYLGITSPDALRQLLGWVDLAGPAFEARLAELETLRGSPDSFHPKAWRIADASGGIVVVGSSNLSRAALETGVEWNLVGETSGNDALDHELFAAFDDLWQQATPLSAELVDRYVSKVGQASACQMWDPPPQDDRLKPVLLPRPWQQEALASLAAIRGQGYQKALVAVATGLGKTWLAAFDVLAVGRELGRPPLVLVIAHRAEILAQAEATLRQAMEVEWGSVNVEWWVGSRTGFSLSNAASTPSDRQAEACPTLVIASIQKLSRPDGLAALAAAPPFDYCVIDEVHHAEAPSYRRVLARLSELSRAAPSFTLGLTATPERTDGVDVATLFDDILAYQATIGDGIAEGSLVPFRYRGLKDDVDFEQIPWRNGRFDPAVLEAALENAPRMERVWAEWQAAPAGRTLVFCCSRRHAVYVRDWLRRKGVSAAAVFSESGTGFSLSNPSAAQSRTGFSLSNAAASTRQAKDLSHKSDPRMASLAAFHAGTLSALCVVDLFNEGVDIPLVDRVVMLRPTESKIVFLQQLGRGLRAAEGKLRLEVIDFVGNHRVFASRLVHLLSLAPAATAADATGFALLKRYLDGREPALPEGCVLDVELEAKELLARFLPAGRAAVEEAYRGMRAELGRRPTPTELLHAHYLPHTLRAAHGSWFGFCRAEGDLDASEDRVVERFGAWLGMLETTNLNKSYKMVVLRVLLDRDALWDGMEIDALATACRQFLVSHPALRADLADIVPPKSPLREQGDSGSAPLPTPSTPADDPAFTAYWLKWPLSRWMDDQAGQRWFTRRDDRFVAAFTCPPELRAGFESLTGELVDLRLAHYSQSRLRAPAALEARSASEGNRPITTFRAKVSHSGGKPILFLPTVESVPSRPTGPTRVRLPDGREWVFRFVKVACNVAHPADAASARGNNALSALLRDWFGPDAGLPGTNFEVEFTSIDEGWSAAPLGRTGFSLSNPPPTPTPAAPPPPLTESPAPTSRYTTHVPVYDLTAAAGFWGPESVPEEIGWTEVPGVSLKPGMFVARVTGTSMEPLIPDGSWCLFRPCPAGSREGRIVLVQLGTDGAGEHGGRFTVKKYHSELSTDLAVTADGWRHRRIQLLPLNPAFEPIEIEAEVAADIVIVGEHILIIPDAGFAR
jgi:superfamily II DNA or RNA helicase/diadenosine tetraphosphate (Ap4A) HIT family hydrolase/HKD family nuclease/SOS-response transcriptional repressor LexA